MSERITSDEVVVAFSDESQSTILIHDVSAEVITSYEQHEVEALVSSEKETITTERQITETLETEQQAVEVIEDNVGKQGPEGRQGARGESGGITFDAVAGEDLSALKAVYENEQGRCFLLSSDDEQNINRLIGITKTAGAAGEVIAIQRHGAIDIGGLGLSAGRVFLGSNGCLTQIPPSSDYDLLVGYAVSDKKLYIQFDDSILLNEV